MNKITIRDVAKEAGVSIATVSKALNGVDVVTPKTKEKVLLAAEKLHYVPNLMGKQLKAKTTKMLGFYTSSITGPYFSTLVDAIAKEAETYGYGINVFISTDKKVVLNSILGNIVDGVIGFEDMITSGDLEAIKRERINAVFIDRNISSETIGSVVFDSYEAGKAVTEHLLHLGHRKICYIAGFNNVYDNEERFRGYLDALKGADISFDRELLIHGYFEEQASYRATLEFLKDNPAKATAFVGGNDLSAIGAVKAMRTLGYEVPKDYSVVGFDDIDLLEYFTPQLTTIQNPIDLQGKTAVSHLISLINGQTKGQGIELKGNLIIRQSTRKI
ncbi:LacI family DNA-binding transcriptional regulator [Enterococcus nangangensis]|uniref:LacI family DNA-binding transcriptional regulator n=1 Tax=Enterococcus nangangensis TaxID=2559926 RepID=UPI0010FA2EA7|nr:LacI family DNA-binding transcriptional regulator [Enterococcus nangangensis]